MLICSQCGFENPNQNKFCQQCGASLTENTCPACGALVPVDSVDCQECGAVAGVLWWAILQREHTEMSATDDDVAAGSEESPLFLDERQRYRLIDPLPSAAEAIPERQVKVLDCQPFQMSLLGSLVRQELETAEDAIASLASLAIPAMARPYLLLSERFYQAIPLIHDAWQQDNEQVVLLEDRSDFPFLSDLWQDEEPALPPLQMLHWFYEMVELWDALAEWQCQQSLLDLANLRVDEDQAICLQRLYNDPPDVVPALAELGQVWQKLLTDTQAQDSPAIAELVTAMTQGKLATKEDVQAEIEAIANQIQPADATVNVPDDLVTAAAPAEDSPDITVPKLPTPSAAPTQLEVPLDLEDDDETESDNDPTVVLPMQLFSLDDVGRTDIGRQRRHNEDYFGIETQMVRLEGPAGRTVRARNLYILCDGMGGQADGEVASAMAVDSLKQYLKEHWQGQPFDPDRPGQLPAADVLITAINAANNAIYEENQQKSRSGIGRMGTTLAMALVQDTELVTAHVGDSRIYRYTRKRGLEQLSIDHEVGQREIQRGVEPEIAYARPDAYQLTQALGPRDNNFIKPDVQYQEINEDALFILCSDGLSDNDLLEKHCDTHIAPLISSRANLEQGVSKLIDLANDENGHDNITVILIRAKVRPNLATLR